RTGAARAGFHPFGRRSMPISRANSTPHSSMSTPVRPGPGAAPGRWPAAALAGLALALAAGLSACGGGGGGGGGGTAPGAPAGLSYAQPSATYEAEVPIAPNQPSSTGGAIDTYTVLPSLPAGIALDASTGVI